MARKKTTSKTAEPKNKSEFRLETSKGSLTESDTLVVFAAQSSSKNGVEVGASKVVGKDFISSVASDGLFGGKLGETYFVRGYGKLESASFANLLLVGVGPLKKVGAEQVRRAAAYAYKALAQNKVSEASVDVKSVLKFGRDLESLGIALSEGFLLASYKFTELKTEEQKPEAIAKRRPNLVALWFEGAKGAPTAFENAVKTGRITAECTNLARRLGDLPGNLLTPSGLGDAAINAAEGTSLKVSVWDKARIEKERMGLLLGVSQGSVEDPRFIVMEYRGDAKSKKPICFVGKGLTFDAGGTSIKPSAGMEEMKYDMCGGAAVIATMRAIAKLKLKINVFGLIPASENLPGPTATKPGDVHVARNGKTVEINNTDAEGRLILGDALTFATELNPAMCVDAATLTGAMKVALGDHHTGFFSRDGALSKKILAAAKAVGEPVWEMPLNDEHLKDMKGTFADLSNISSSAGGAGSAKGAAFLSEFIGKEIPWAHFDIAGTAWHIGRHAPYNPDKGASGVIVRTFIELAKNWK